MRVFTFWTVKSLNLGYHETIRFLKENYIDNVSHLHPNFVKQETLECGHVRGFQKFCDTSRRKIFSTPSLSFFNPEIEVCISMLQSEELMLRKSNQRNNDISI